MDLTEIQSKLNPHRIGETLFVGNQKLDLAQLGSLGVPFGDAVEALFLAYEPRSQGHLTPYRPHRH